jgi:hypothetical protein
MDAKDRPVNAIPRFIVFGMNRARRPIGRRTPWRVLYSGIRRPFSVDDLFVKALCNFYPTFSLPATEMERATAMR